MSAPAHPVGAAAAVYLDAFRLARTDLAASVGVAPSTLTRWFNGTHPIPLDCIPKIERFFGLPRGRLLLDAGYVDRDANLAFERTR